MKPLEWAWRLSVLLALLWCGYELRGIHRDAYAGPSYSEEATAKQSLAELERIRSELEFLNRQLRR